MLRDGKGISIQTYYKKKDLSRIVKAEFKYLLFNYHEGKFKVKQAKESRLFNPTSLANLDIVQNEIKEAIRCCVKLP